MNRFLVSALALVVFASGCAAPTEPTSSSTDEMNATTGGSPTQVVQTSAGEVLAAGSGMSLYTFDRDVTSESTCYDACATRWPALVVAAGTKLAAPFATTARQDGSLQLTLGDKPLYFFANDLVPGDVKGDGVGGVWHLARPVAAPVTVTQVVETLDGEVLGDADGMSLYTFDNDTTTASTCYDGCAARWPAALAPEGATIASPFGTTARDDGAIQLTLAGKPLYRFAGDAARGDINGDGLGGVWHLARP